MLAAAHHQAATNPKTRLLHRDISGGNILIYPRVKLNEDGVNAMTWCGILSDWELAKPVDDDNAPSKATQAEQMVRSCSSLPFSMLLTFCVRGPISSCQ